MQEEVPASSSSTCQPSFVRNFGLATSPTGPANSRSVFTLPTRSNKNSSSNSTDVVAPNTTKKAGKATSSSSSTQTPVATPGSIKVPKATRQRWQQWQRDLTVPRSYRMINTLNVPPVNNPAQKPKVLTPSELVCVSPNASSVPKEVFGNDAPRFTWIHVYVPSERKTVDTPNVPSQAASSSSGAAVIGNPAEEKPAPSASTRQVMKRSSFPEKGEEIPLSLINHYSQMRWKTDEEIWTPSERKAPNIAGVQPLQPSHSTWVIAVEKIGGSWHTI